MKEDGQDCSFLKDLEKKVDLGPSNLCSKSRVLRIWGRHPWPLELQSSIIKYRILYYKEMSDSKSFKGQVNGLLGAMLRTSDTHNWYALQ